VCADISGVITGVSPVSTIATDTAPDLTFTGAVAASSNYIGFGFGDCSSPSVFQYASAPETILSMNSAGTYVVCYSIDGGQNYVQQSSAGNFVVQGTGCSAFALS
jgi:hypothetical protein